jgi:hypothetical protein
MAGIYLEAREFSGWREKVRSMGIGSVGNIRFTTEPSQYPRDRSKFGDFRDAFRPGSGARCVLVLENLAVRSIWADPIRRECDTR